MGEHQLKVDCTEEYRQRLDTARQVGRISNYSGLCKTALGHAMEHGQSVTEELLRNGPADTDGVDTAQLDRIEKLLHEHQLEHDGQDPNDSSRAELWLKVVAAFAFISVILSATAVYLVARQVATA